MRSPAQLAPRAAPTRAALTPYKLISSWVDLHFQLQLLTHTKSTHGRHG